MARAHHLITDHFKAKKWLLIGLAHLDIHKSVLIDEIALYQQFNGWLQQVASKRWIEEDQVKALALRQILQKS